MREKSNRSGITSVRIRDEYMSTLKSVAHSMGLRGVSSLLSHLAECIYNGVPQNTLLVNSDVLTALSSRLRISGVLLSEIRLIASHREIPTERLDHALNEINQCCSAISKIMKDFSPNG